VHPEFVVSFFLAHIPLTLARYFDRCSRAIHPTVQVDHRANWDPIIADTPLVQGAEGRVTSPRDNRDAKLQRSVR